MLNDAQLISLRAECFSDPTTAAFFDSPGNASGLRAYLNGETEFIVWRTLVNQDEIMLNGFDWVRVDNLSVGKSRIWEWMFDNEAKSINPSKTNIRAGIDEVWKGTAADLAVRAAVYTHCKRAATDAEQKLATGTGSSEDPGLMSFEGEISDLDAARLIYKDDGTIWTAQG